MYKKVAIQIHKLKVPINGRKILTPNTANESTIAFDGFPCTETNQLS